jgi:hypothetical protein
MGRKSPGGFITLNEMERADGAENKLPTGELRRPAPPE